MAVKLTPVCFEDTLQDLKALLPPDTAPEHIRHIAMQSSLIPFPETGEALFKVGDAPLGFYWILQGQAFVQLPFDHKIKLGAGDMAGLDNFLNKQPHQFDILSAHSPLKALFIDRPCFLSFKESPALRPLIFNQLLQQFQAFKKQIV